MNLESKFKEAQWLANQKQVEVGVWKVSFDLHDASRVCYLIRPVSPWPQFTGADSVSFVDSVYPEVTR